jgi:hypothetical protein
MSVSQPPRLASWLLHHLASSPQRESLAGDLIERYHHGHSATWYWRQVLAAILAGVMRDLRDHKLLAVRAVAIGWLLAVLFSFPVNWMSSAGRAWIFEWLVHTGRVSFWWVFWSGQLPYALLAYVACVISGSIVARLHQAHAVAMVALYAATVSVVEYGTASWMLWRQALPPMPELALILWLMLLIGHPIGIVIGGLWALRADGNTTRLA